MQENTNIVETVEELQVEELVETTAAGTAFCIGSAGCPSSAGTASSFG
ncbi:thiocillin family RiPP [Amycolatopsis carbonis]|uniref:Thiocillin family RiPP n=1 Tax=Amycolatopsis carbonis TaxID=715471 RepID=A0A9Y2MW23_9PSEU|nr:thiocillin family RiPP [Amycolatopsis sp. 2-15]WIX80666.1 thiocillin family RiPP [Amycolatopsis sp. 2-15]